MQCVNLNFAKHLIDLAIQEARTLNLQPITVAVLDSGGHLVALVREDGSSNLRPKIAIAKAAGALALGIPSRKIAEMCQERPAFFSAIANIGTEGLIPAAGGVLIHASEGEVIGAIGISGDSSDNDELCALACVRRD